MKVVQALNLLLIATCVYTSAAAQCTGNCPAGSLPMPTSSATLAAGNTYCITSTTDLSGNTYNINGTLIIQAGNVTLGNVNIEKTGVILVKNAARLKITGNITGNPTAPVSTIDNLIICSGGLMNFVGSFSQGQINITVSDFGAFQITGAWTAGASASSFKIGKGAVVELCASFNMNKNGFFTETSTEPSYLITHSSTFLSTGSGWLSTKQNASNIKWTADGPVAFVSHPASNSCLACGNYNLAPSGTNAGCGSSANALYNTVLASTEKPAVRPSADNTDIVAIYPNPVKNYLYLQLPKKHSYTNLSVFSQAGQLVHTTTVKTGSTSTRYDLPAQLPSGIYFVRLTGNDNSLIVRLAKD